MVSTELPAPPGQTHCLLDPPLKRVQPSTDLFAFILSGGGENNSSLSFPELLLGRKAGDFWTRSLSLKKHVLTSKHFPSQSRCSSSPGPSASEYPPL